MKAFIRKTLFYLGVTSVTLIGILVLLVMSPGLLYAHKAVMDRYTIYYDVKLDSHFQQRLINAAKLVEAGELYDNDLPVTICLNDHSVYPSIIRLIQGPAFGYGFGNKIVIDGQLNIEQNYSEVNEYKWNFTALLAHEMTHCMQFHTLGLLASNPVANYPSWKWEGYAEYVARGQSNQKSLQDSIERLQKDQSEDKWGILFEDGTYVSRTYYKWWLLVQYCITIQGMTYKELLNDSSDESLVYQRMMSWYRQKEAGMFTLPAKRFEKALSNR